MQLTKQTLQDFLALRPAISMRKLSKHAGVHENAINQLYNACNCNLTEALKNKLLLILPTYGWIINEYKGKTYPVPEKYKEPILIGQIPMNKTI